MSNAKFVWSNFGQGWMFCSLSLGPHQSLPKTLSWQGNQLYYNLKVIFFNRVDFGISIDSDSPNGSGGMQGYGFNHKPKQGQMFTSPLYLNKISGAQLNMM